MLRLWSVVVPLLLGAGLSSSAPADSPPADKPSADKPATDFTLTGVDGKETKLSELKGKVVYLEFFATWCGFSRRSLPHTQTLAAGQAVKDGELVVLGVTMGEDKEKVQGLLNENEYAFSVLLDDGAVGGDYDVKRVPTHVVIGRDGKIAWRGVGYDDAMGKSIDKAIEAALAEADTPRDGGADQPKQDAPPPDEADQPAAPAPPPAQT